MAQPSFTLTIQIGYWVALPEEEPNFASVKKHFIDTIQELGAFKSAIQIVMEEDTRGYLLQSHHQSVQKVLESATHWQQEVDRCNLQMNLSQKSGLLTCKSVITQKHLNRDNEWKALLSVVHAGEIYLSQDVQQCLAQVEAEKTTFVRRLQLQAPDVWVDTFKFFWNLQELERSTSHETQVSRPLKSFGQIFFAWFMLATLLIFIFHFDAAQIRHWLSTVLSV
jgi:hypothetical protein